MLGISRHNSILSHLFNLKKKFTFKLTFRTWLFFVTSFFIIGIGIYLLQQSMSAKAAWFDDEYGYRQRIPISNSGSAQTDFQVGITLNTSTLISAGKMQSDCDDIRFTAENGEVLPYWIEENNPGCNQTATRIWIKASSIPASDSNIYVYYGNTTSAAGSDGNKTFLFFDDFNNGTIDSGRWVTDSSTSPSVMQEIGSTLQLTAVNNGSIAHMGSANRISDGSTPLSFESKLTIQGSTGPNIRDRMYLARTNTFGGAGTTSPTGDYGLYSIGTTNQPQVYFNAFAGITIPQTQNIRIIQRVDSTNFTYRVEDAATASTISNNSIGNTSVNYQYIQLISTRDPSSSGTSRQNFDWVFVRKFASTLPTIGTFGTEEITPGPVAYWKFDEGADNSCPDGSDACDSTENKWNMSISGNVARKPPDMCVSGSCLYFDGNGDFLTQSNSPNLTRQFTMSAWVKSSDFTPGMYVIEVEYGEPLLHVLNHDIMVTMRNAGNTAWDTYASGDALVDNEWNHIAVTYDSSNNVKFYHNGRFISSTTHTGPIGGWASTANTWIGGRSTVYFNGFIDEPKIYAYARSDEQIKADFIQESSANGSSAVLGAEDQSYLSNGLAGYWKMDESTWVGNNAVLDSSGNLYAGTANGNAGITAPGRFGNGGVFDGNNDNVTVTNSPSGTTTNRLTVSAWVYPRSPGNWARMVTKENTSNQAEYRLLYDDTGKVYGLISLDSNEIGPEKVASIPNLTWSLLTMTYDGSKIIFYVNGSEVSRIAATGSITTPSSAVLTFGSTPHLINEFTGNLDEVRIYNRALSPSEVSQLYEWAPGPVVHYKMDENAGSSVSDISANGYTGSFGAGSSAPIWEPGKYGSSLKFDGTDDRVDIGTSTATISGTPTFTGDQITVSAWVKASDDFAFAGIVGKASNSNWTDGFGLFTQADGISPRFYINTYNANFAIGNTLVQNDWNFLVGTYDGATIRMYVNGKEGTSDTLTGAINDAGLLQIGTIGYYTTEFEGNVDDVRIYNYVRTPKQITQDMNAGHPAVGSPVSSPVAYWKLDEGYGTTIHNVGNAGSTLNGTFGTGTSAPTWSNSGKFGKALSFDGSSDYYTAIGGTELNAPDEFTISLWANPTKYTGNTQNQALMINKGIYPNYNYRLITDGTSGNKFEVGVNVGSTGFLSLTTNNTFSTGTWYNVVGAYDGNYLKIYVNGKLDNNVAIGGTLNTNTTALYVGKYSNGVGYEYKGLLDEIKIYNYALSNEEIKVEYNQGKAIVLGSSSTGIGGTGPSNSSDREYCVPGDASTCSAPVGEWKFDENIGTSTVNDSSGNANTGTMQTFAASAWVPGIKSSALNFDDASDYIEAGSGSSLNLGGTAVTVTAWINPLNLISNDVIASKGVGSGLLTRSYMLMRLGNNLYMEAHRATGAGTVTGTTTLSINKWQHAAAVYDGSNMILYLNGVQDNISTGVTGNLIQATTAPFFIGRRTGQSEYFAGKIDEVKVYNYARTPAQIAWDYSKGAPVAHYKMDECEGATIYNSAITYNDAPAGNNGTLTIGASGTNTSVGTCSTTGAWFNGATGKRGASIDFDGTDDYISLASAPTVSSTGGITYSIWVYPESYANGAGNNASGSFFIDRTASTTPIFTLKAVSDAFCLQKRYDDNSGLGCGATSSSTIQLNTWTHVVMVREVGSNFLLYVNGVLSGSGADTGGALTYPIPRIGINTNLSAATAFNGKVDDFRIFNYALTSHQVKTVYNNGAVSFE